MKTTLKKSLLVSLIVVAGVVLDQVVKLYILSHFRLYDDLAVTNWFHICYILNDGMAFGVEWFDKLALTLFRLVAVGLLGWYLHLLIHRRPARTSYLVTIAFVMAGALGNIVDCVCYGKLFQGGEWMYGKVVDMFYFPLWTWPDWLPFLGGQVFFRPVFNFADSCITVAVFVILFFYSKQLSADTKKKDQAPIEEK